MELTKSFTVLVLVCFAIAAFVGASPTPTRAVTRNPVRPPLHFRENGRFKIVTLTDLHYGEDQAGSTGPANDQRSVAVTTNILRWEHPDFVVLTGDLVSGEAFSPGNGSSYIDMLVKPLMDGGYKWASTYGNHDIGNHVTRAEILAADQKHELSYTQQAPEELIGNTNYYLPVYPPPAADGSVNTTKPAAVLWLFDSRGGRDQSGAISAYVHENVVQWFRNESRRMLAECGPNAVPFLRMHISIIPRKKEYKPIHDELDTFPQCVGQKDDIVTPQEQDTGLLDALIESGVVKTAFVGHNHGNSWCCYYRTMELCYNRQSGHGGGWVGWVRGARVVELSYADPWRRNVNYVRLETGEIVESFPRQ